MSTLLSSKNGVLRSSLKPTSDSGYLQARRRCILQAAIAEVIQRHH